MESVVETQIIENNLEEQFRIYEKDGKLLVKTSELFNVSPTVKQNEIVSNVVEILLKSNKTDTMLTVGLTTESEITMKVFDTFQSLSLSSQEQILRNISMTTRKMADMKETEKINTSEWIN